MVAHKGHRKSQISSKNFVMSQISSQKSSKKFAINFAISQISSKISSKNFATKFVISQISSQIFFKKLGGLMRLLQRVLFIALRTGPTATGMSSSTVYIVYKDGACQRNCGEYC